MEVNNDNNFVLRPKNYSKRNLSSTDISKSKKLKPLFTTVNIFSPLAIGDTKIEIIAHGSSTSNSLLLDIQSA